MREKKMLRHKEPPSRREEKKTRFNQSKHSPASESRTTTLDSREFEMFTCWLRCALFTVNGKSNYRYYFLPPIWLRVEFWEFCSVDSTAMRSRFSLYYSNERLHCQQEKVTMSSECFFFRNQIALRRRVEPQQQLPPSLSLSSRHISDALPIPLPSELCTWYPGTCERFVRCTWNARKVF